METTREYEQTDRPAGQPVPDTVSMNRWKREALQSLAAGVAHDLNNVLMVVLGSVDLMLLDLDPDNPVCELAQNAQREANKAVALCKLLSEYAAAHGIKRETIDAGALVRDRVRLPESCDSKVELVVDIADNLPRVNVAAERLSLAMDALVENAANAIGQRGGTVRVTVSCTDTVTGTDEDSSYFGAPVSAPHVAIAVADDGVGMAPDTQSRMFDPYFSHGETRRKGLGLCLVPGIVQEHNGSLHVASSSGAGTTVTLRLPVTQPKRTGP